MNEPEKVMDKFEKANELSKWIGKYTADLTLQLEEAKDNFLKIVDFFGKNPEVRFLTRDYDIHQECTTIRFMNSDDVPTSPGEIKEYDLWVDQHKCKYVCDHGASTKTGNKAWTFKETFKGAIVATYCG